MRDTRKNKRTTKPKTVGRRKTAGGNDKRANDILELIRSRQADRRPTLEDTLTPAQHKRLKPLAWLIQNQAYTTQEIQIVSVINEQRLQHLAQGDQEFSRQQHNKQ